MSEADIDDDFDDDFTDDEDAKRVEEAEVSARTTRLSSLEKRRLIDNLLEEKRLAKALKDELDDLDGSDDDDDFDADWDDDDDI